MFHFTMVELLGVLSLYSVSPTVHVPSGSSLLPVAKQSFSLFSIEVMPTGDNSSSSQLVGWLYAAPGL